MPSIPAATKGNLLALRKSRALADSGYELLDRKQRILMAEMVKLKQQAQQLRGDIDAAFGKAYAALQQANASHGLIDQLAQTVPVHTGLRLRYRSVMGVELPQVTLTLPPPEIPYSLLDTDEHVDLATNAFREVLVMTAKLSEVDYGVYRLSQEIKKTRARANALKNIVLPQFAAQIAAISQSLEEKEREELSRLKAGSRKTL